MPDVNLNEFWPETVAPHVPRENRYECSGLCLTGADVGVPECRHLIAYSDPDCPLHGDLIMGEADNLSDDEKRRRVYDRRDRGPYSFEAGL